MRLDLAGGNVGTAIHGAPDVPTDSSSSQNHPIPFNPATTTSYAVPGPVDVSLTVFDLLGRQIRVLASGRRPAGTFVVSFDATGLPSGVYFYRLEAGDFVETKRMMLLR